MQLQVRNIRVTPTRSTGTGEDDFLKLVPRTSFLMGDALEAGEGEEDAKEQAAEDGAPPLHQSRLQTIASLVNTMMGTTIVALPFGLSEAGLGSGMVIIAVLGACSCYTALILARASAPGHEFSAVVARYLGGRVQAVAWAISLAIIVGAAIVYHILMQETLYALVDTVASGVGSSLSPSLWRREYAALIPWLLFPISNLKNMSALVKFNSLGFLFLWYTIIFMWSHGFRALAGGADGGAPFLPVPVQPGDGSAYEPDGRLRVVLGGSDSFAGLGGMMMLSFFLHNCFQPIVKNANPATVHMDMGIAYVIAALLYGAVGVLGYVGMADARSAGECAWGPGTTHPATSPCTLASNFLAMFGTGLGDAWSVYALSARVSLLLQLFTVFPLLLLIIRAQVWGYLSGTAWPGFPRVAGLNFAVMCVTFACAAVDAKVSDVLRFVGAIGGLVIVYAVPLAVHAAQRSLGARQDEAHDGLLDSRGGAESMDEEVLAGLGAGEAEGARGGSMSEGGKGGKAHGSKVVALPPSALTAGLDVAVMAIGTLFFVLQFVPALAGS